MNPIHKPGNEPDPGDMAPDFDPEAEAAAPGSIPNPGEKDADALGDFA